jgi:ribonuclease P protein component
VQRVENESLNNFLSIFVLPRGKRLTRKQFPYVATKGKVFHTAFFSFRVAKLDIDAKKALFSCVISKKIATKAVTRNTLKRRIMASVQGFLKEKPEFSHSVIIYPKKGAVDLQFKTLNQEISSFLGSF